eukprot:767940-Hanusia_phi.AAC.3
MDRNSPCLIGLGAGNDRNGLPSRKKNQDNGDHQGCPDSQERPAFSLFGFGRCATRISFCKLSACFPYSKRSQEPVRVEADFVLVDVDVRIL